MHLNCLTIPTLPKLFTWPNFCSLSPQKVLPSMNWLIPEIRNEKKKTNSLSNEEVDEKWFPAIVIVILLLFLNSFLGRIIDLVFRHAILIFTFIFVLHIIPVLQFFTVRFSLLKAAGKAGKSRLAIDQINKMVVVVSLCQSTCKRIQKKNIFPPENICWKSEYYNTLVVHIWSIIYLFQESFVSSEIRLNRKGLDFVGEGEKFKPCYGCIRCPEKSAVKSLFVANL